MTNKFAYIFFTFIFITACQPKKSTKIIGNWQATTVLEEKRPLEVDVKVIKLSFHDDQNYTYHGTLKYKEAGTYSIEKDLLYTLDTLNFASIEKAVKITLLTDDSLHIKMNENGKERIIKFIKESPKDNHLTTE